MKTKLLFLCFFILLFANLSFSQTPSQNTPMMVPDNERTGLTLENISTQLTQLTKALQIFNQRLNDFLDSVNKYKGIQISEKQQKLLFGYEILNQTEQLAATLRKSLVETGEREATIKRRLGQIQIDMQPENIERAVQIQGTTKANELRENKRRALEEERNTLQNLLFEIQSSRTQISENLREAETFAQSFRKSLFAQIRNAMEDF